MSCDRFIERYTDFRDGLLDVFISTWPLSGGGVPDVLFHNEGALRFSQVPSVNGSTVGMVGCWGDYDGDGDIDLIAADSPSATPSFLYVNQRVPLGQDSFLERTTFANGEPLPAKINSAALGDCDNDGDLDLLLANARDGGCDIFRNDGAGAFSKVNVALGQNLGSGGLAWLDGGTLTIRSLARGRAEIQQVTLLGSDQELSWSQTEQGVTVRLPETKPCEYAFSLKLAGDFSQ